MVDRSEVLHTSYLTPTYTGNPKDVEKNALGDALLKRVLVSKKV